MLGRTNDAIAVDRRLVGVAFQAAYPHAANSGAPRPSAVVGRMKKAMQRDNANPKWLHQGALSSLDRRQNHQPVSNLFQKCVSVSWYVIIIWNLGSGDDVVS